MLRQPRFVLDYFLSQSHIQKIFYSINQFIASAVAEKMSALMTEEYLVKRAEKGNEQAFLAAMSKVPDVEPEPIST